MSEEKEKVLLDQPMKPPPEVVVLNARPNPTIHHAIAQVIVSIQFLIIIPLQCYLLQAAASTMTKPSCMKKIIAVEVKIQLELAPVFIASNSFY